MIAGIQNGLKETLPSICKGASSVLSNIIDKVKQVVKNDHFWNGLYMAGFFVAVPAALIGTGHVGLGVALIITVVALVGITTPARIK